MYLAHWVTNKADDTMFFEKVYISMQHTAVYVVGTQCTHVAYVVHISMRVHAYAKAASHSQSACMSGSTYMFTS